MPSAGGTEPKVMDSFALFVGFTGASLWLVMRKNVLFLALSTRALFCVFVLKEKYLELNPSDMPVKSPIE